MLPATSIPFPVSPQSAAGASPLRGQSGGRTTLLVGLWQPGCLSFRRALCNRTIVDQRLAEGLMSACDAATRCGWMWSICVNARRHAKTCARSAALTFRMRGVVSPRALPRVPTARVVGAVVRRSRWSGAASAGFLLHSLATSQPSTSVQAAPLVSPLDRAMRRVWPARGGTVGTRTRAAPNPSLAATGDPRTIRRRRPDRRASPLGIHTRAPPGGSREGC